MEVEEDPCSQFVDFTNATPFEQFISDAEQTLIAWHLAGKGHASANALEATHDASKLAPFAFTRVLEFDQPHRHADGSTVAHTAKYALTLFLASDEASSSSSKATRDAAESLASSSSSTMASSANPATAVAASKQWAQGREHFTPTMLAIADATRDLTWRVASAGDGQEGGDHSAAATASGAPPSWNNTETSSYDGTTDNAVARGVTATIARDAARWFGVDEFFLVTRTSLSVDREEMRLQQQQQHSSVRRASRNHSSAMEDSGAAATTNGLKEDSANSSGGGGDHRKARQDAAFDGTMDANEANLVLSAIHLALLNCNCTIPAFVPVQSVSQGTWLGTAVPGSTGNVAITFETDSIPEVNANQSCISGLLDFFHLKLQLPPEIEDKCRVASGGNTTASSMTTATSGNEASDLRMGTWVSAAFRYSWLKQEDPREVDKPVLEWRYVVSGYSKEATSSTTTTTTASHLLPSMDLQQLKKTLFGSAVSPEHYWGAMANPVMGMELTVMWPNLREGTYVDNAVHSTLDPQTAPEWMIDVRLKDTQETKPGWTRSGLYSDLSRKPTMPLSRVVANLVQAYAKARELNRDILVSELAPTIPTSSSQSSLQQQQQQQQSPSSASSSFTKSSVAAASSSEPTVSSSESSVTTTTTTTTATTTIPAARAAVVFGHAIGSITSSIVSAATWKGTDMDEIRQIVAELFDVDDATTTTSAATESRTNHHNNHNHSSRRNGSLPSAIAHATPVGELVSVLACRMGQLQGVNAMSLLWVEFVKALRERWFQQRLLPLLSTSGHHGDDGGCDAMASTTQSLDALFLLESTPMALPSPDFHQCLLHQKLQLLNCCILRQAESRKTADDNSSADVMMPSSLRRLSSSCGGPAAAAADAAGNTATRKTADLTAFAYEQEDDDGDVNGSPSDDEFFDSIEANDSGSSSSTAMTKPAGVLREIPGIFCLLTGVVMNEPITQAAVPLTEDIAKQQQELLSRLGVGSESTMLRQQMQSAALISDMQAFKAANSGACLADFIRWYSPKDWIPASDPATGTTANAGEGKDLWWFPGQGMLSERMRHAGASPSISSSSSSSSLHVWHQMWNTSAATPVSKQKCLFDAVEESEKLYDYLETISPHEMFHQMLVGAISSCFAMLEKGCLPFGLPCGSSHDQAALSTITAALHELRGQCDRAVALLDDAFAASQVVLPTGRDQKEEQAKAKSQLQVAFEMALDACRTMARSFEEVEMLLSQASALLQYFAPSPTTSTLSSECIQLVDLMLAVAHHRVARDQFAATRREISCLLRQKDLRTRVAALVLQNPLSKEPVQREYVLRCICPRPYLDDDDENEFYYQDDQGQDDDDDGDEANPSPRKRRGGANSESESHDRRSGLLDLVDDSPVVVNRMYASFTKHTVRFALTLADSEF